MDDPDSINVSVRRQNNFVQILQENRTLLVNNIILSEEFYRLLHEYKVIPPVMIEEVKNTEDRLQANNFLLTNVGRLGSRTFEKFCDVLMASGHIFLAEHIRAEVERRDANCIRDQHDDVFKKFPAILKVLSPGEQKTLSNYIKEKVTDGIIKNAWKFRSSDDNRKGEERIRNVNESIFKDKKIRENEAKISYLQEALHEERRLHHLTQRNMADLEVKVHDLQVKYNDQLRIMMTSYDASERANMECDNRLRIFDRQIKAMNVQIQKYHGVEEYAAQADAGNVKVSRLQENVNNLLDTLMVTEQEVKEMHRIYDEERRLLFQALGLDDDGQDLRTAFLNSQQKMNSEVKRLTAEVDLLSMAFGMESVWNLFDKERQKTKTSAKDKTKGTQDNAIRDVSDFDYVTILCMIRKRLHEVHMEIEKLKKKNLIQERKIGKLRGQLDLIKLQSHVDASSDLQEVYTPTTIPSDGARSNISHRLKAGLTPRRSGAEKQWNNSTKLSPVMEAYLNQDSETASEPVRTHTPASDTHVQRQPNNDSNTTPSGIKDDRLPPIKTSDGVTSLSNTPASPGRKSYPDLTVDRRSDRRLRTRDDEKSLHKYQNVGDRKVSKVKSKEMEQGVSVQSKGSRLKQLDFADILSDSKYN